jgi:hypothetical protein
VRALGINFVAARRPVSLVAAIAALAGLLLLGAIGMDYLDTRDALSRAEKSLERLQRGARTTTARAPVAPAADSIAAERAMAQLLLPWGPLLDVLEARTGPAIALLSLDVQGAGRTLRVTGEARAMADVLDYVRALRGAGPIAEVVLSGHEARMADAAQSIRFTLDIRWGWPQ